MKYLLLFLAVTACGDSSPTAAGGVTPASLAGTYTLRNYDSAPVPTTKYGVESGSLTLRSDSTYTITLTAVPLGTTPAGWQWTFVSGRWSYMGHYFDSDVVFLRPSFAGAPTWNGTIISGGVSFSGNGYPDVVFTR